MNKITETLRSQPSVWGLAHPDDAITAARILFERFGAEAPAQLVIASKGEETSVNNYTSYPAFGPDGWRAAEGLAIGDYFGFQGVEQNDEPDGKLNQRVGKLAIALHDQAMKAEATALVSTFGQRDHPDHAAMGAATNLAALWLARDRNTAITVIQLYNPGQEIPEVIQAERVVLPPAPEAIRFALDGVARNGSQHRIRRADSLPLGYMPEGYSRTPDGEFFATPETMADLHQYSIWSPLTATVQIITP